VLEGFDPLQADLRGARIDVAHAVELARVFGVAIG
jgi:hypothetical protein